MMWSKSGLSSSRNLSILRFSYEERETRVVSTMPGCLRSLRDMAEEGRKREGELRGG